MTKIEGNRLVGKRLEEKCFGGETSCYHCMYTDVELIDPRDAGYFGCFR